MVGGLLSARRPLCYPQVAFQLAFPFLLKVPRYKLYTSLVSAPRGSLSIVLELVPNNSRVRGLPGFVDLDVLSLIAIQTFLLLRSIEACVGIANRGSTRSRTGTKSTNILSPPQMHMDTAGVFPSAKYPAPHPRLSAPLW